MSYHHISQKIHQVIHHTRNEEEAYDLFVVLSIKRLSPIFFGPKAQTSSATFFHSFPSVLQISSNLIQNSSGFATRFSLIPVPLEVLELVLESSWSSSIVDEEEAEAPNRCSRLMVVVFARRKEVIDSGRGMARMTKVSRPDWRDPIIVPLGRPTFLTGAISVVHFVEWRGWKKVEGGEELTNTLDGSLSEWNNGRWNGDLYPSESISQIFETSLRAMSASALVPIWCSRESTDGDALLNVILLQWE